ncbi:phosphotransferase family protein [Haloactinomyces albus]|uniref:Thiamine kinase n=1 Tax=Haloactinomyces albus TaxID=1352928 RepID=A0AAE3ZG53_9ACTN|nr:phosphotransferase [Haloactinomyces albus]MDR7303286.1 hypothetical protein [Haloactinomyces albus]
MSVEITTGPPEVRVPASSEVTDTVGTAESVLASRTGAPVRLADAEDLGGSDRSVVMRVRVAETPFELPRTLVVKHYGAPSPSGERSDPFAHEAASCQLATALPPEIRVGPELIAQDSDRRLLVLEDLGRGSTLADVLFADDPRAAERALLAWARSLGRLHTTMAGREADFDALMRRIGATSWTDPVADDIRQALSELPELLEQTLGVTTPQAVTDRLAGAAQLLGPGKYRSFSPSDICPDNSLVTGNGVRFLDFEWACVRDIALDAAYLQFPFPSSWCSYAMPESLAESMLATWRSEVVEVWPDLDEDEVLGPRLFDAQMLWVWVSTWWFLPRSGQSDTPIAAHMPSPRRSTALADRWQRLRTDAESVGVSEVAEYASRVVEALVERFGSGALELRTYPAFR